MIDAAYRPVDYWLFERSRTDHRSFEHETRSERMHSIVAELDGELAGHAALSLDLDDEHAGAWIWLVAVAPQAQGLALPALLLEECERRARDAGHDLLQLSCVRENGLETFYASLGFATVSEEHGRLWDATRDWTLVHMTKELR